jgi:tetratricopeptide (TPR) repeat protein
VILQAERSTKEIKMKQAPRGKPKGTVLAGTAAQRSTKEIGMKQAPRGKPKGTVLASTACIIAVLAFCAGLLAGSVFTATRPGGRDAAALPPDGDPEATAHIAQALAATERDPRNPDIWVHLGNLYFDSHNPAQAIPAYEKALELRPGDPNVMTDLGIMYRAVENFPRALELFSASMSLAPDHQQSHFNKGIVLLFDLGRPAEAVAVWREFLSRHPDARQSDGTPLAETLPQLAREGGLLLEERGNIRAALAAYEQALLLDPLFLSALLHKAALLEKAGRAEEAAPVWARALEIDPRALAPDGTPVKDRVRP